LFFCKRRGKAFSWVPSCGGHYGETEQDIAVCIRRKEEEEEKEEKPLPGTMAVVKGRDEPTAAASTECCCAYTPTHPPAKGYK
jgi:hypothetical protein